MVEIPGYRVIRELGRGGMATVYLAVQESLRREVALKVLGAEMARDPEFTERFLREARLVASLHHKHIVQVHDVGTHAGHAYLAMEYLPDGAITQLAGSVDAATALDCVQQIASALDYGHARGIVHRDVKLENILRHEDGSFTLSDFGIARVSGSATVRTLQGLTLGTPHYMSPERWMGVSFDGRADLYSLGVVLHALATGKLPYDGVDDVFALGSLHREAAIPLLPQQFGRLQGLLAKLMAKRPEDRHASGAEVVAHVEALRREGAGGDASVSDDEHARGLKRTSAILREWPFTAGAVTLPFDEPWWRRYRLAALAALLVALAAGAFGYAAWREGISPVPIAPPVAASIAVLPFGFLPQDTEAAQIADLLADELATELARHPGLTVTTPATLALEQRSMGVRDLGRALGVKHAFVATLRRDGAKLVLGARLVDTATGFQQWAESYTRTPDEIWSLQQSLAARVAASLLSEAEAAEVAAPAGAAYALYLRGRQQLDLPTSAATLADAQRRFEQALAEDPTFARAQAGLCRVETRRFEIAREPAAFERASAACARASEIDPGSREIALAQGELSRLNGRHADAIEYFERAAEAPLLRAAAYGGIAKSYAATDESVKAEDYFARARRLQPGNWRVHNDVASYYLTRNQYASAIDAYRTAIALSPEPPPRLFNNLGAAYLMSDDFGAAAETFERSIAILPTTNALGNLGTAQFHLGRYAEAAEVYRRALALAPDDYAVHGNLADALAQIPGREAETVEAYRRAVELAEPMLARRQDARDIAAALAWYLANLGERARALELVGSVASSAAPTATLEQRIAEVYARLGDAEAAKRHADRAIALGLSRRVVMTPWLVRTLGSGTGKG